MESYQFAHRDSPLETLSKCWRNQNFSTTNQKYLWKYLYEKYLLNMKIWGVELPADNFSIKVVSIYSEIFHHSFKVKILVVYEQWTSKSSTQLSNCKQKSSSRMVKTRPKWLIPPLLLWCLSADWRRIHRVSTLNSAFQFLASVSSFSLYCHGWGWLWSSQVPQPTLWQVSWRIWPTPTRACFSSGVSAPIPCECF